MSQKNLLTKQQTIRDKKQQILDSELSSEEKSKKIIMQAKKQLDNLIMQLDEKVKIKIQANQSKFLYAYKNHLDKITKQLKAIKENYDVNQKKFCTDTAIVSLGRQCALFRQQAMRLHSQLEDALTDADIYKRKSQIMESELNKTNKSLKQLIHRIKIIEISRQKLLQESLEKDKQIDQINKKLSQIEIQKIKIDFQPQKLAEKTYEKQNLKLIQYQTRQKPQIKKLILYSPQNQKILQKYPIFEIQKSTKMNNTFYKNSSPSSGRKTRTKTNSTYQYVYSHRNFKCFSHDLEKQNQQEKLQQNLQAQKQHKEFSSFIHFLKKTRSNQKEVPDSLQIKSKFINQFINNEEDIKNLCHILFPCLQINQKLQASIKKQFIVKKQNTCKNITQLSTELMRKINPSTTNKKMNQSTKNNIEIDCLDLEFLHKKQKLKTQQKQSDLQMSNLLTTARNRSIKKMNQVFKKKTITSKCNLNVFYPPTRQFNSSKGDRFKK